MSSSYVLARFLRTTGSFSVARFCFHKVFFGWKVTKILSRVSIVVVNALNRYTDIGMQVLISPNSLLRKQNFLRINRRLVDTMLSKVSWPALGVLTHFLVSHIYSVVAVLKEERSFWPYQLQISPYRVSFNLVSALITFRNSYYSLCHVQFMVFHFDLSQVSLT